MLRELTSIINSKWHKNIYIYALYLSYALFFIAFTGIFAVSPQYLTTLETIIKYYVCGFLLLRFNPWVSKEYAISRRTQSLIDVLLFLPVCFYY